MSNNYVRFFALLLFLTLFVSCSIDRQQGDQTASTAPAEVTGQWTILYYGAGNYAGDLMPDGQSQTIAAIHGLQDASMPESVHAVALITTTSDHGDCRFYDVRFRMGEAGTQISSAETDWGLQDMSSPQLLKQFVDSAVAMYPARHYALIIGGSGEAWRGACRDAEQ